MTQQKKAQKQKPTQAQKAQPKKAEQAKKVPAGPTNQELFDLKSAIEQLKKGGSNSFKLAMMDNEDLINPEVRKLNELQEPSENFKKYQEEYRQLLQKHAEIDQEINAFALYSQPDGQDARVSNPGPNSFFNIVHDEDGWKKAIKDLQERHKDTLTERDKQMKEFDETLQKPAKKLNLVKVSRGAIPSNVEVGYEELRTFRKWIIKE